MKKSSGKMIAGVVTVVVILILIVPSALLVLTRAAADDISVGCIVIEISGDNSEVSVELDYDRRMEIDAQKGEFGNRTVDVDMKGGTVSASLNETEFSDLVGSERALIRGKVRPFPPLPWLEMELKERVDLSFLNELKSTIRIEAINVLSVENSSLEVLLNISSDFSRDVSLEVDGANGSLNTDGSSHPLVVSDMSIEDNRGYALIVVPLVSLYRLFISPGGFWIGFWGMEVRF